VISPKARLTVGRQLQDGDAILLLESSGIHANGVSLARKLAAQLPHGYGSRLADGRLFGEALLDPTIIYSPVTEALFAAGVVIHYMANITGHGWRKLMRHPDQLTYRMTVAPPVPVVLQFLVEKAGLTLDEAYGSLNMGAGFALFVEAQAVEKVITIAGRNGIKAYHAGMVEAGPKRVIIEPLGVVYEGESLQVRL